MGSVLIPRTKSTKVPIPRYEKMIVEALSSTAQDIDGGISGRDKDFISKFMDTKYEILCRVHINDHHLLLDYLLRRLTKDGDLIQVSPGRYVLRQLVQAPSQDWIVGQMGNFTLTSATSQDSMESLMANFTISGGGGGGGVRC